ncbi:MAG: hypothetical protein GX630_06730 [Actinobacteria bacterium]|nr:hypothetical protein [Actinomycetota bacterium]
MRKRRFFVFVGCMAALMVLGALSLPMASACGASLRPFQLTHNEWEDSQPDAGGGLVAWHYWDGIDWEVKLLDLLTGTMTQLTSNGPGSQDQWPDVDPSGRYVVYTSHQRSDTSAISIKLYDVGAKTTRTIGAMDPRWAWGRPQTRLPQVAGDAVVWVGYEGNVAHVYLHTISSRATKDLGPGYNPVLGDSYVAWSTEGAWIAAHDLTGGAQSVGGFQGLTNLTPLSLSGDVLLFSGVSEDGSSRLVLYSLAIESHFYREIAPVGQLRSAVMSSGGSVAWIDEGGLWTRDIDGPHAVLVTDSPGESTSGGGEQFAANEQGVAWVSAGSSSDPSSWRILYYDFNAKSTVCLSEHVSFSQNQNPRLWQDTVVWQGKDATDAELFMANATGFADVAASSPHAAAIVDFTDRGVILGFGDGTFRPNTPVTRQQFAKMIVKALELTVTGSEVSPFIDVAIRFGEDPFYPSRYVAVCAAQGITKGKTATTFDPASGISREQLITMVARAAGLADPPATYVPSFTATQFSLLEHYQNARKAAYAAVLAGLQGVDASCDFGALSSRGECAQLLYNMRTFLAMQPPGSVGGRGTAGDQDLINQIQAFWSGVDIFLPRSLPSGWRLLTEQDVGLWGDYRESNPSMGYQVMSIDNPCWYSVAYTNGAEVVSLAASGSDGSGGSRYYWERAESATPISLTFEGRSWEEFRYSDNEGAEPDTLLLHLETESSDGPWSPPNCVDLSFSSSTGRGVALSLAGSMVRIAREKPDEWVRELVDQIGATYQGEILGEICLPSSLPSGWHVASLGEIARASGSALAFNPLVYAGGEEDGGIDIWFSNGNDAVELGVDRFALDVVGVDWGSIEELDVEFLGQKWRLPQSGQGSAGVRHILWGGSDLNFVSPLTLTFWGERESSLEALIDFARRMRPYSVSPAR